MPRLTETRALREKLPHAGQRLIWCSEITGFGCRIMPSGVRTWIVQCRLHGKEKRITLGPVGTLAFEGPAHAPGAVDLARAALNAARRGEDPMQASAAPAIRTARRSANCGRPTRRRVIRWRTPSASSARVASRSIPIAGTGTSSASRESSASAFDDPRTRRWLDTIAELGAQSHALVMLKSLISFGASRALCEPHKITLKARPSRKVQNFLKTEQLKRLDAALIDLIAEQPERIVGFSAIRLMLHTGMRKGEVRELSWDDVDLEGRILHLQRDKSSGENVGRDVLLTDAAVQLLRSLPRMAHTDWVFFGRQRDSHIVDLERYWSAALERAGIRRVRMHDLRHSFASLAIANGISLYTVGKLLGHRDLKSTARYSHLSAEAQREASDLVGGVLA